MPSDKPPADNDTPGTAEHTPIGPWVRTSQRLVYDNPWLQLTHETVLTPAGTAGIYGKIHFKNRAIGIVPVDAEQHTWLVGQHRYTLDAFSWEIPMGGGPLNESPLATAQRELAEETGLQARQWREVLKLHTSNSVTDEEGYVFMATELVAGEQALEDSESDLILKRLPLQETLLMIERGEITDGVSVAGLLAVARQLRI